MCFLILQPLQKVVFFYLLYVYRIQTRQGIKVERLSAVPSEKVVSHLCLHCIMTKNVLKILKICVVAFATLKCCFVFCNIFIYLLIFLNSSPSFSAEKELQISCSAVVTVSAKNSASTSMYKINMLILQDISIYRRSTVQS